MSGARLPGEKRFVFAEEGPSRVGPVEWLEVAVPEVPDPQYGMYVWPCAVVLAQYVWFSRNTLRGKTILEIGAGAGLPGIVAAKCGANVILSDSAEIPNCLDNCRLSCQINNLEDVPVIGLTWGQISPDLVLLPQIDIILGSDVFYDTEGVVETQTYTWRAGLVGGASPGGHWGCCLVGWRCVWKLTFQLGEQTYIQNLNLSYKSSLHSPKYLFHFKIDFENILTTVFYLIRKNPHALFWTTYQERCADWSIESLLYKWNLKCVHIPLETFKADEEFLAGSNLPGSHSVHMMIITLETSILSVT